MRRSTTLVLLVAANALFCCVLSFYRTSDAATKPAQEPFANSVEQRIEMNNHLREIRDLLKEQNALLRSGTLKVVVAESAKR
jgi:large-conductance mechanosensitive channel